MPNEDLQLEIQQLKQKIENLERLFYKDNYSNLEVKTKQVKFNSYVGFYGKNPIIQQATITAPSGGGSSSTDAIDISARTAINQIKARLTAFGLTL